MTNVPSELQHIWKADDGTESHLFEARANPDLLVVCGFAVVGVLLTVFLARVLPIEALNNVLALAN